MTSLFSPKPSIRSRPSRNGGLGGFVQVEVLAEEYGCSPTETKEKRSSMINIFEKKRKRKSAPPPLAITLAQQGFVESAVTTGESMGFVEETETPPVPELPKSPLRSVSSPLVTMWSRLGESESVASDRDSTVVQIGEVKSSETSPTPAPESSEDDRQKIGPEIDREPQRQNSRTDTLAVTLVDSRHSSSISPQTPRGEPDSYVLSQHSLHFDIHPTSPTGISLFTPLDKALPPLPSDSIEIIKQLIEPVELPGSILLPNQGFKYPSLVPDRLSVDTIKTDSSESTDDDSSIYSRTTSGSVPSLSVDSSPESKMRKFASPQKVDRHFLITAPVESMENMDMEQLLSELPNYTASTVSSMWLPAMKSQVKKEVELRKKLEDRVNRVTQMWAESSLNEARNIPLRAFSQHVEVIKASVQENAAKYCEAALYDTSILDAKIESLTNDLSKIREDLASAHALIDEHQGCISDQSHLIGRLHDTHDTQVSCLARFILLHAQEALFEDKYDLLAREVLEIMHHATPVNKEEDPEALPPLPKTPVKSNASSPAKSGLSSPFRSLPISPTKEAVRRVQIREDEYVTLRYQNREMQSTLLDYKQLAADQKDTIHELSGKSDEYVEQIKRHSEAEQSQSRELEYLRHEIKLFKKDIKGYKEDEKLHQDTKAAMNELALQKLAIDEEVQKLKQALLRKEIEASSWKTEAEKLRKENNETSRPSSAVSQVSEASLKSTQSSFAKSVPKIWQSSFNNERNRGKEGGVYQKQPNVLRRGQSSAASARRKNLTIDTNVASHNRSRSQSAGGLGVFSRKMSASKSMVHINTPKMVPSESPVLQRGTSQREPTKTTVRIGTTDRTIQSAGGKNRSRSSSGTDEEMAKQMAFYGIIPTTGPRDLAVEGSDYSSQRLKPVSEARSRTEKWINDEPGRARLLGVPENTLLPKFVSSPKARNILGIRERSDSLNAPKTFTGQSEPSKASASPLRPQDSQSSQPSVVSKASSVCSGTTKSTTSKRSNSGASCGIGTTIKLRKDDPRLTTILDKKLPTPPENTPPRKLAHRSSRQDTLKAPATAPILTPSKLNEHLDLDPMKHQQLLRMHDPYRNGSLLGSPLKTSVSEKYPSREFLSPAVFRPQELTYSPYSDGSGGDKKVEVDESDYNDGSPAQRILRRKRAIGRSKTISVAESSTSTPKATRTGYQEPETPDSAHSETARLGQHSMSLLESMGTHDYHDSPTKEHRLDEHHLLTSISPDVHSQGVLYSGDEDLEDTVDFYAAQPRPPLPERNHRRILSRVTESNEWEDEEADESTEAGEPAAAGEGEGSMEFEGEYVTDDSAYEEIGQGENAQVLPFMHVPSRKIGVRYVTK